MSGGPFRVIEGGRTGEPTPGLLDRRRGRDRDARRRTPTWPRRSRDVARLQRPDPGRSRRPGRRLLGGPHPGRRVHGRPSKRRSRPKAIRWVGSPGSMPPAERSRPASSIRTRTSCSRARARGSWSCASRARRISTSSRRAAASCRPSRPPARPRRASCSPTGVAGSTRCSATASPRSRPSRATASTSRPRSDSSRWPTAWAARDRIDVVPTWLGAHAVPPEFRCAPRRHRGVRPVGHRRPAAGDRGPRPGAVRRRLLRGRCLHRRPVAPGARGGVRARAVARGCMPTRSHRPVARSSPPSSARRRPTTSPRRPRRGSPHSLPRPRTDRAGRRDAPAHHDLVPHEGPPRTRADLHRSRRPGGDRHRTSIRARRHSPNLPLAMSFACVNLGLSPDEALVAVTINAARARRPRRRDRVAGTRQGRRHRGLAGAVDRRRSRTGPARTSCGPSSSAAACVVDRP